MELLLLWVILIVVGIVLIAFEAIPVLDIPGVAMLVVGIIGMVSEEWLLSAVWYAPAIAAVVAVIVSVLMVPIYRRLGNVAPSRVTTGGDTLAGKRGTVTHRIVPNSLSGKVRIGNRSWSATADSEIPAGAKVLVLASEGVHIIVKVQE
jgi:membrane protein implicated in regulation of membrane protease activity